MSNKDDVIRTCTNPPIYILRQRFILYGISLSLKLLGEVLAYLYEFAAKHPRKEHKLSVNKFLFVLSASRNGPEKGAKEERNENTRRQSCCRKDMVKKD